MMEVKITDKNAQVVGKYFFERGGFFTTAYMFQLVIWSTYMFVRVMFFDSPSDVTVGICWGGIIGITALRWCDRSDYKNLVKHLNKIAEKK